ncbi:N-acetylmuramoyl-L-alanine amidase [Streptomyces sp. WI04-05B]|uniref:N-acetylmuramoyl-L-alanine amidase n=1 Tax=Streptomyces TaxID=1883 RepID=UPI0029AD1E0A|nr:MULTISPECIES: N-acetylmuramoyl-L-alanine amidase [unclassified Streptomyces]MDX2540614.1 N-acetylmuramoyl-L-alanine amidase [Streptomyces sp. WI04-05B]MDX2584954.1 N-acetylmuramoyl-L-alanine amidase [Streptomyces sp. WI04-05A]
MSYAGPGFEPPQPPRSSLRRPLAVALAVLVLGGAGGWFVWEAFADDGSGGGDGTGNSLSSGAYEPLSPIGPPGYSTPSEPAAPLAGKVVVIDPGHNPGNFKHTAEIARKVNIGTNSKECDTTGTATNSGYTEAEFTLDVARRLRTVLEQQGATVKLTQNGDPSDYAYGPCVDERARIGNAAHADAVVSVHADGSTQGNRGFHVILPGAVHKGAADTRPIVASSRLLGESIKAGFAAATGSAPSNYIGDGTGLDTRTDLGGLNLSTVPKVFIECGNMRDSKDAALLTSGAWRQEAAQGISEGIVSFLRGS